MNKNTHSFETARGPIDYTMTNDFIFRALLQRNKEVRTALICALLHLPTDGVDAEITNPIDLGAAFSSKDFILDIRVNLNGKRLIDLEMQLVNQNNWPERSISYAARSFDNLNRGNDYIKINPVNSIGFLDFTLFPDAPEFFATYQLQNIKTGQVYSSKFSIHVVDLSRIDLATNEDKEYGIDRWARLFKSKTWEELRMNAEKNPILQQASNDLYTINADEIFRQQARARADAEFWERHTKAKLQKQEEIIQQQAAQLEEKDNFLAKKDHALAEKDNALAEKDNALTEKDKEIELLKAQLATYNK